MIGHILNASLERGITVSIMYQKDGEITHRNIKVLGMDNNKVKAFCYLRNQSRIFKIENILSACLVNNFHKIAK